MTTKQAKLVELIAHATTGRYNSSLDRIALDALEMIGDELNVLTFAMNEDNHGTTYIVRDELEADLSYLSVRATGIAALLREAKAGRLTLDDDEKEQPAASSAAGPQ